MSTSLIRVGNAVYSVPSPDVLDDLRGRIVEAARSGAAMVDMPAMNGREKSVLITPHLNVVIEHIDTVHDEVDLGDHTAVINNVLRTFDY